MVANTRKVIDWKLQQVVLTIPASSEETVITIDVQPKRGRAFADVPKGTASEFRKDLTGKAKPEKI
jgi:hypothetical protein